MINGMHFDVTSAEMRRHLQARIAHHEERAAFYEKQNAAFADAPTQSMTNDPVKGLQKAGKRHRSKAEVFRFMLDHTPPVETYRLSSNDLQALEFVSERVGW